MSEAQGHQGDAATPKKVADSGGEESGAARPAGTSDLARTYRRITRLAVGLALTGLAIVALELLLPVDPARELPRTALLLLGVGTLVLPLWLLVAPWRASLQQPGARVPTRWRPAGAVLCAFLVVSLSFLFLAVRSHTNRLLARVNQPCTHCATLHEGLDDTEPRPERPPGSPE